MTESEKIVKQFKSDAKKKFRSVRRFCKIAKIDHYELKLLLMNYVNNPTPDRAEAMKNYIQKLEDTPRETLKDEVTEEMIEKTMKYIHDTFGSVANLVKEHPEYNKTLISNFKRGIVKTTRNELIKKLVDGNL